MPEKETVERANADARAGKSPSTQAGKFVREEFRHIREGKHGAQSIKQAIAIGLSKARRAGVKLQPPSKGKTSPKPSRLALALGWLTGSNSIHRALFALHEDSCSGANCSRSVQEIPCRFGNWKEALWQTLQFLESMQREPN